MRRRARAVGAWLGCCWVAAVAGAGAAEVDPARSREERTRSASKPAWAWTLEERMDRRFDPTDSNRRRKAPSGSSEPKAAAAANLVEGSQDPELLLPHEVFDQLLTRAFFSRLEDATPAREEISSAARLRGLGDGFLDDLQELAGPYLQTRSAQKAYPAIYGTTPDPEKREVMQEMERAWHAVCRARNEALQAARSRYGEEPFHRFLYEAVAPAMTVRVTDTASNRERLRFEAQGCPRPAGLTVQDGQEAQDAGKPAWEWTLAERLEALFDPAENRRRLEAHAYAMRQPSPKADSTTILVEGSSNPELILPHQLFERLVRQLYSSGAEAQANQREKVLPEARKYGLGDDLLETLEKVAPGYLAYKRQEKERFERYSTGSPAEKKKLEQEEKEAGLAMCAARKQGLEAARSFFGQEKLDRFLYEVIAPGMSMRYPDRDWKEQLLYIEGGCR